MTIFYIRPAGTKYGNAAGSSYADAFSGMPAMRWDRWHVGDRIVVSGQHAPVDSRALPFTLKMSGALVESNPADPAVFLRHYLAADGLHDVILDGLAFHDSGQIRTDHATRLTLRRCIFSHLDPSNTVFIELGAGNHDWVITGGLIEYCGNAIYTRIANTNGNPAQRLTVFGVAIRHIATGKWLSQDGHAVGIQGGSGHKVLDNTINDCGTAICAWAPSTVEMTDIRIHGNRISNCRALAVAPGSGIEISGSLDVAHDLPKVGWRHGCEISENTIDRVAGYGISTNIRDALVTRANVISNCGKAPTRFVNPFEKGQ